MYAQLVSYLRSGRLKGDLVFLGVLLCLHSSVFASYVVPTGSMQPTIREGERFFANKLAYRLKLPFTKMTLVRWALPERGDIIVFKYPQDEGQIFTKRVVGLPGDRVLLRDKRVYLNGEILTTHRVEERQGKVFEEEMLGEKNDAIMHLPQPTPLDTTREFTVPENMLFVLGDNRDNSADSRIWGFVPQENVEGELIWRWFAFREQSWIPALERFGFVE